MDIQLTRIDGKQIKISLLELININDVIFKVCSISQLTNKIEIQPANSDQIKSYLKYNPGMDTIRRPELSETPTIKTPELNVVSEVDVLNVGVTETE